MISLCIHSFFLIDKKNIIYWKSGVQIYKTKHWPALIINNA